MMVKVAACVRSSRLRSLFDQVADQVVGFELTVHEASVTDVCTKLVNGYVPDVFIADINICDEKEISCLESFVNLHGSNVPVIATADGAGLDAVLRLMRLGLADFLPQPLSTHDLLTALEKVVSRPRAGSSGRSQKGRVISIVRPCGGMGATTLAVQSALSLLRPIRRERRGGTRKPRVCLLDFDLQGGSAAVYLDLQPKNSVLDLVSAPERLDTSLLGATMTKHKSGLDVLAAPPELVAVESVTPESARRIVELSAASYDHVFVDLPQTWTPWTTAILRSSDVIVLVVQMTVSAIRHARQRLNTLERLALSDLPLVIVGNRRGKARLFGTDVEVKEAERALGQRIDYFISSDFQSVSDALNQGVPIAEIHDRSRVEKEFRQFYSSAIEKMLTTTDRVTQKELQSAAPSHELMGAH